MAQAHLDAQTLALTSCQAGFEAAAIQRNIFEAAETARETHSRVWASDVLVATHAALTWSKSNRGGAHALVIASGLNYLVSCSRSTHRIVDGSSTCVHTVIDTAEAWM